MGSLQAAQVTFPVSVFFSLIMSTPKRRVNPIVEAFKQRLDTLSDFKTTLAAFAKATEIGSYAWSIGIGEIKKGESGLSQQLSPEDLQSLLKQVPSAALFPSPLTLDLTPVHPCLPTGEPLKQAAVPSTSSRFPLGSISLFSFHHWIKKSFKGGSETVCPWSLRLKRSHIPPLASPSPSQGNLSQSDVAITFERAKWQKDLRRTSTLGRRTIERICKSYMLVATTAPGARLQSAVIMTRLRSGAKRCGLILAMFLVCRASLARSLVRSAATCCSARTYVVCQALLLTVHSTDSMVV